jgi:hypothetical protein
MLTSAEIATSWKAVVAEIISKVEWVPSYLEMREYGMRDGSSWYLERFMGIPIYGIYGSWYRMRSRERHTYQISDELPPTQVQSEFERTNLAIEAAAQRAKLLMLARKRKCELSKLPVELIIEIHKFTNMLTEQL